MTKPTELKPCPFCGGKAVASNHTLEGAVNCKICGAVIFRRHQPVYDTGYREAIAAWNTRTPDPAVQALVEAARPLAAMAGRYDPEDGDGDLECWSGLAVPKIKHIRALRAALAAFDKTD